MNGANSLISSYAHDISHTWSLSKVYEVLQRTAKLGLSPDEITYSALINKCLEFGDAVLVLDLYTTLRVKGVNLDDVLIKNLLKVCRHQCQLSRVDCLLEGWVVNRDPIGDAILGLLGGQRSFSANSYTWTDLALTMYREAINMGIKPTIHLLNATIACLRKAPSNTSKFRDVSKEEYWIYKATRKRYRKNVVSEHKIPENEITSTTYILDLLDYNAEGSWDHRAFQLIEESIKLNLLIPFQLSRLTSQIIDLRELPPQISELYLIYLLENLRKYMLVGDRQKRLRTIFTLLMHPFNPKAVFKVSGRVTPIPNGVVDPILENSYGAAQGLGVTATLRRIRLRHISFPEDGKVVLEPYAVQSWIFTTVHIRSNA